MIETNLNLSGMQSFQNAKVLNAATYADFFNRLMLLATTLYEWRGLPPAINLRFLERTLFLMGKAVFHVDPTLGPMVSKVTPAGQLNYYDEPVKVKVWGINYQRDMGLDECVVIRNNPLMEPTRTTIQLFANRLYEVERALDLNVKAQKFPILIRATQQQQLSLMNIYAKYDGNAPVIVVDKALDPDSVKVFRTDAPFVADKLMSYKHDIWNEAMSFLGISNANTDKRERLITDEVAANDQLIQLAAEAMLATRREAAAEISKRYGLNVTVRVKEYEGAEADEMTPPSREGDSGDSGEDGGTDE